MSHLPVASRYARSLLAAADSHAEEVLHQLDALGTFLRSHAELTAALSRPTLMRPQRIAVLEAVLKDVLNLSPIIANLLRILVNRNRFSLLPLVTQQYRALVDVQAGRIRGTVRSAVKLTDTQIDALKHAIEKRTQRTVLLEAQVDPSLIGGAVAQVGDFLFDGTFKAQLAQLLRVLSTPA